MRTSPTASSPGSGPAGTSVPPVLDRLIPAPGLREVDSVTLALPLLEAWEVVRHTDLAESALIRGLFAVRTLPGRLRHEEAEPFHVRIDDLGSTAEQPGFQVLLDEPPEAVAVGAIGQVWRSDIPFVHVESAEAFAAFDDPGYARVAWSISLVELDERTTRVEVEVRVDATDEGSWRRFRRYFRFIGPGSRFIRRRLLAGLDRRWGVHRADHERDLPGDELLPDAAHQITQAVTIEAPPEAVWPWLVQMGCRRGGFYSIDLLDNGRRPSAREVHPELQDLAVGDVVAATPEGDDGFEVLVLEPDRLLVLGGLFDGDEERQLAFVAERPEHFWQVTWAFVLEPTADGATRLITRARAAHDSSKALHARVIRPMHHVMQASQLRHLKARAEGRLHDDTWREVLTGVGGAAVMAAGLLTPFLRDARSHWGVEPADAAATWPGDELVPEPRWQWTHGVEVDAPVEAVWPWVAQVGADRGGFYSYQWLENLPGCDLRNAETVHPDWALEVGDGLVLHPAMPPLPVVQVEPGRFLLAHGAPEPGTDLEHGSWADVTWLFHVEPLGAARCRVVSRYRCATSDDVATRLQMGATFVEPVGFAMDRKMLLGIKQRAETT